MGRTELRVLHVIASLAPVHGGTTTSVLEMMEGLEEQGVTCEVALSDDAGPGIRLSDDAEQRSIKARHYFQKKTDFYLFTPAMGPWLRANVGNYDLVHIHGLFSFVNGLAGSICRRSGVPYVVTPHGMANRYGMNNKFIRKHISFFIYERKLLEHAAAIHMCSSGERQEFCELGINAPVFQTPLAVSPISAGTLDVAWHKFGLPQGQRVALFIGRLDPVKNLEVIIDAIALPEAREFHLLVCGAGEKHYEETLKRRAKKRGVYKRITWMGFVDTHHKADVFALADVCLLPSASESFGVAAVEAISAGRPCVVSEGVGIGKELATAGFAVRVNPTAGGVAGGLLAALKLKTSDFEMKSAEFARRTFSRAMCSRSLLGIYEQAIRKTGPDTKAKKLFVGDLTQGQTTERPRS